MARWRVGCYCSCHFRFFQISFLRRLFISLLLLVAVVVDCECYNILCFRSDFYIYIYLFFLSRHFGFNVPFCMKRSSQPASESANRIHKELCGYYQRTNGHGTYCERAGAGARARGRSLTRFHINHHRDSLNLSGTNRGENSLSECDVSAFQNLAIMMQLTAFYKQLSRTCSRFRSFFFLSLSDFIIYFFPFSVI